MPDANTPATRQAISDKLQTLLGLHLDANAIAQLAGDLFVILDQASAGQLPTDDAPAPDSDEARGIIDRTPRGFAIYAQFTDVYGEAFSVQQSSLASLADRDAVWIGRNSVRGHLDVEQAAHVRDALDAFIRDVSA